MIVKKPILYVRILGMQFKKHHLMIILACGIGCMYAGNVYHHDLARDGGDVLLLPAAERILARLEGE